MKVLVLLRCATISFTENLLRTVTANRAPLESSVGVALDCQEAVWSGHCICGYLKHFRCCCTEDFRTQDRSLLSASQPQGALSCKGRDAPYRLCFTPGGTFQKNTSAKLSSDSTFNSNSIETTDFKVYHHPKTPVPIPIHNCSVSSGNRLS